MIANCNLENSWRRIKRSEASHNNSANTKETKAAARTTTQKLLYMFIFISLSVVFLFIIFIFLIDFFEMNEFHALFSPVLAYSVGVFDI